jgi:hypothetical protein
MPDYSKGLIYTIRNREDDTKIYVGSTIQPLYKRFHVHKSHSKREECMNRLLYIEVNGDWTNWYIELYENYPCNSKNELEKREGEIIRLIGTLNKIIAGRDDKQYYIENKDNILKKNKQYRFENADNIKEQKKEYHIKNKEYIINKVKKYTIENADKIKEYKKQYHIENADKIKEKRRLSYLKKKEEKLKKLSETTS